MQRNDFAFAPAGDSNYWREVLLKRLTRGASEFIKSKQEIKSKMICRMSKYIFCTAHPVRFQALSMREVLLIRAALLLMLVFGLPPALAQNSLTAAANLQITAQQITNAEAIKRTQLIVQEVVKASYPELKNADIQVQTFHSASDYFRTSFSFGRFLSAKKMRYFIKVNPRVFALNAPEEGVRAIVAHELGHAFAFHRKKRICLLGLVRLSSKGYITTFERRTDLQAILRGYSEGLKAYRMWLYQNIPAKKLTEKRRNYFSPKEIEAIELKRKQKPELMQYWFKHTPRNLAEIETQK
jgi:hypothetical protein